MTSRLFSKFAQQWSSFSTAQRATTCLGGISTLGLAGMVAGGGANTALHRAEQVYQYQSAPFPQSLHSNPPNVNINIPTPPLNIPFSLLSTAYAHSTHTTHTPGLHPPTSDNMTAFQMDGRLYPNYETYMLSEGFLLTPYARRSFDKTGPYSLAGAAVLITLAYQVLLRTKFSEATELWYLNNMSLSYDNRKKPWVYLTSACTHLSIPHLAANGLAFISFAPSVGVVSAPAFAALFTALALSSSLISLGLSTTLAHTLFRAGYPRPSLLTPAVGASGAICGMLVISALSDPTIMVSILAITPSFNILNGLAAFMTLDLIGLIAQACGTRTGFSHAGHLGGYASGLLAYNLAKSQFDVKYPAQSHSKYGNWIEQSLFPQKPQVIQKIKQHQ